MEIKGSVALVTGGASGLGEACVRSLLEQEARVAILDCAKDQGERIASELGAGVLFCQADVTDEASTEVAVDKIIRAFGAIHFVVNCAGVNTPLKLLGKEGPMPIALFNRVVQINLIGTVNVIRLAVEQMIKNRPNSEGERGVVVNTASIAAFEGQIGQSAYAASKAGVVGLALPLARELAAHGIRVMTIAPGIFGTEMMAALSEKVKESLIRMTVFPNRLGRPEEFARLLLHIIENPMLNGQVIRLDGALSIVAR